MARFLVYASQFGQESSLGEHHSLPVFAVLVYVGLGQGTAWGTALLKLHMVSLYFAAGLLKVVSSAIQQKCWCGVASMQYYVFASLWSRPGDRLADALRRLVITRPLLCTMFASSGLAFECGSVAALCHPLASVGFGLVALCFHMGVFVMQGISFVSYWCPALLVFLIDPAPLSWENLTPADDAPHAELWCWRLAALHCAAQCAFAPSLHER